MTGAGQRSGPSATLAIVVCALAGILFVLLPPPHARAQQPAPAPAPAPALSIYPSQPAPIPSEILPRPERSYELKRAIEVAVQNHPAIQTTAMRTQSAKTGIAAAGAKFRPFIEGHASAERVLAGDKNQVIGDSTVSEAVPSDQTYTGSVNFVVPIVREGRLVFMTLPSEDVAAARYNAVRNRETLARADVVGAVSVTFFTALSAQEDLKVSEQFVELNRVLLQSARLRFQQQLVPQTEVQAAEAALASSEADLAMARVNVSRTLSDFATAIGADPSPDLVEGMQLVENREMPSPPDPLEGLLKRVATTHPLVLAQEAAVHESEAVYRVLVSERYPKLDFSTKLSGADTQSSTQPKTGSSQDTDKKFWNLRALLSLNWRLWDFGALSLRLKEQTESIQAEKFALAEVRSQVSKGVINAYRNVSTSRARLNPAEKAVMLAEQQVRNARQRYQQNLIPRSELLKVEAQLAAARKTLIQAEYGVRIDQAILQIALGVEGP